MNNLNWQKIASTRGNRRFYYSNMDTNWCILQNILNGCWFVVNIYGQMCCDGKEFNTALEAADYVDNFSNRWKNAIDYSLRRILK